MTNNKILYGLAIVAGGAFALWAGLPPILLLFLACPVAMMFMMGGMHGGHGEQGSSSGEEVKAPDSSHSGHHNGSHDRI